MHWLFAMGDTLPANLLRTLAVLATHPTSWPRSAPSWRARISVAPRAIAGSDYLAGCILEAMRLWPTTPLFGRVASQDVRFPSGACCPPAPRC